MRHTLPCGGAGKARKGDLRTQWLELRKALCRCSPGAEELVDLEHCMRASSGFDSSDIAIKTRMGN